MFSLSQLISVYCVSGGTLQKLVELDCYLPEEMVRKFGSDIAQGLYHLHQLGVIFANLCPQKVCSYIICLNTSIRLTIWTPIYVQLACCICISEEKTSPFSHAHWGLFVAEYNARKYIWMQILLDGPGILKLTNFGMARLEGEDLAEVYEQANAQHKDPMKASARKIQMGKLTHSCCFKSTLCGFQKSTIFLKLQLTQWWILNKGLLLVQKLPERSLGENFFVMTLRTNL